MALSRRLGVVAILGSCWFTAVACGDDDSNKAPDSGAGAGGEAGDDSGSGGSQNNAGKSGSSTAGKNNGGNSGMGGSTAGTGGTTPEAGTGAGGEGAAPGGGAGGEGAATNGGAGGEGAVTSGGAGGEGGAPVVVTELKACSYDCNADDDCSIILPDAPPNTDLKCNQETKKCEKPPTCAAKDDCVPDGSYWFFDCVDDSGCFEGQACVTWQGKGWCADMPTDDVCLLGGTPETLPHQGAQGTVSVCVDHSWICGAAGACEPGCTAEAGCGDGNGDSCNLETGQCECEAASECNTGVCGADDKCAECATNEDCSEAAGQTGLDVCVEGKCGCSSANKCVDPGFKNVTPVCE